MFKANERCYNQTFGLYGLETLNHRSELKILWDTFRSQIAELWFPYDRRIADDRRRSQKIEHGSIFCDHDRRIAGDRRSVFPYDRRRSQNFLRSAIRDPRSSAIIWKPALRAQSLCTRCQSVLLNDIPRDFGPVTAFGAKFQIPVTRE